MKKIRPTTPVDVLNLSGNKFTRIPAGLTQFEQLINVNLSSNAITAVNAGDLNVSSAVTHVDISSNAITAISANSLPRNFHKLIHFFIRLLKSQ